MNNTKTIHLIIRNRENILYDADVRAVSAINNTGPFDILPDHANFISVIEKYIVIHDLNGKNNQIKIEIGIVHVDDGKVEVYLSEK